MSDNRDAINDILNELDRKNEQPKSAPEQPEVKPEPVHEAPVHEAQPEYVQEQPAPAPQQQPMYGQAPRQPYPAAAAPQRMNGAQPPGVHRMAAIALWQIVCYNETNRSLWRCWDETNCIFITVPIFDCGFFRLS